jgi:hypothetical protein
MTGLLIGNVSFGRAMAAGQLQGELFGDGDGKLHLPIQVVGKLRYLAVDAVERLRNSAK